MLEGFTPFLLLLVITVFNVAGGTSVTTASFYVPHEAACREVEALFQKDHSWGTKTFLPVRPFVGSIAIATCIPMRGVQHMKEQ